METEGEEIEKMLDGYISFLKKSKQGANEPGAGHVIQEETEPYSTESLENTNDETTY